MPSQLQGLPFQLNPYFAALLFAWILVWKGLALWRAGRNNQQYWFIILLLVNTFGILELIYYFAFQKERQNTSDSIFSKMLSAVKNSLTKTFSKDGELSEHTGRKRSKNK